MSKYIIYFERFIGRCLTRRERDIIVDIECARRQGDCHRVFVVDPPGYDSRKLLCAYYNYLHRRVEPDGVFLVMAKNRRDAAAFSGCLSRPKDTRLITASGREPDDVGTLNFNYALLLDTQAYNPQLPTNAKYRRYKINHYSQHNSIIKPVFSTVESIILNEEADNFIIVHFRQKTNTYNSIFIDSHEISTICFCDPFDFVPHTAHRLGHRVYYPIYNTSPPATLNYL